MMTFEINVMLILLGLIFLLILLDTLAANQGWNRWLEREDDQEIVSRRPVMDRGYAGLFAAGFAWTVWKGVIMIFQETMDPSIRFVPLVIVVGPLFLLMALFLFGAGPYRLRLDVQRREYFFTQGFPLFTWTRSGPTNGGEVRVISNLRKGVHSVWFRGGGSEKLWLVENYRSQEQAQALAGLIAERLNLTVQQPQGQSTGSSLAPRRWMSMTSVRRRRRFIMSAMCWADVQ